MADQLNAAHRRMLEIESGISAEVIAERGYRTVTSAEAIACGFSRCQAGGGGLMIPVWGPSGDLVAHSFRPDVPRTRNEKAVKYEWPVGVGPRLDVPPGVRAILADPTVALWITEGSKKADAAVSHGVYCLGLIGVWNFRGTNSKGGSATLGDFEQVALKGRTVYLAFDSDVTTKRSVRQALERLSGFLKSRGAKVVIVQIPSPDDSKVGLDDYLAARGTLEELISGPQGLPADENQGSKSKSGATILVELLDEQGVDLWHDDREAGYATYRVDQHLEHAAIQSRTFTRFCERLFYQHQGKPIATQARTEALSLLEARAGFDGDLHPVASRVGCEGESTYLFLANPECEVVHIHALGHDVIPSAECPIRFVKGPNALALPRPERGGNLELLLPFPNVGAEGFELITGCMVGFFLDRGTLPILVVSGEQGSGKSFGCRIIRSVVDPVKCPVRAVPRDVEALAAAVQNGFVLAFDNLSGVTHWLSDALCGIASGTGFASRELYTNSGEHLVVARKPLILNGIDDLLGRADLADRSVLVNFQRIGAKERKLEKDILKSFDRDHGLILGALIERVSRAIANRASVRLDSLPRLADFANFVNASEEEGRRGTFVSALYRNKTEQHESAAEGDQFTQALRAWVDEVGQADETAGAVLAKLGFREGLEDRTRIPLGWPKSPKAAANQLNRLAPVLRGLGYEVEKLTRRGSQRPWRFVAPVGDAASTSSSSSFPSPAAAKESVREVTGGDANGDGAGTSLFESSSGAAVPANLMDAGGDGGDGSDEEGPWGVA